MSILHDTCPACGTHLPDEYSGAPPVRFCQVCRHQVNVQDAGDCTCNDCVAATENFLQWINSTNDRWLRNGWSSDPSANYHPATFGAQS